MAGPRLKAPGDVLPAGVRPLRAGQPHRHVQQAVRWGKVFGDDTVAAAPPLRPSVCRGACSHVLDYRSCLRSRALARWTLYVNLIFAGVAFVGGALLPARRRPALERLPAAGFTANARRPSLASSLARTVAEICDSTAKGDESFPLAEQRPDLTQLLVAADERGDRHRKGAGDLRVLLAAVRQIRSAIRCLPHACHHGTWGYLVPCDDCALVRSVDVRGGHLATATRRRAASAGRSTRPLRGEAQLHAG
jgi:hypothetical protein